MICSASAGHELIYLGIAFLTVMVVFLSLLVLLGIREFRAVALRISYLEGTSDLIYQAQTRIDKLLIAYMENE